MDILFSWLNTLFYIGLFMAFVYVLSKLVVFAVDSSRILFRKKEKSDDSATDNKRHLALKIIGALVGSAILILLFSLFLLKSFLSFISGF